MDTPAGAAPEPAGVPTPSPCAACLSVYGSRVYWSGFWVQGFGVRGEGFKVRVEGVGFRVW